MKVRGRAILTFIDNPETLPGCRAEACKLVNKLHLDTSVACEDHSLANSLKLAMTDDLEKYINFLMSTANVLTLTGDSFFVRGRATITKTLTPSPRPSLWRGCG